MKTLNQEKIWDEIAKPWKEFRTKIPPAVKEFLKNKKGRILDLGCGSGRNFIKISGLDWYGVDFSEKMINYASERAEKFKINIHLTKSDSSKLKFKNNFFDAVLCYALIHCIDSSKKRTDTLKEIYRVLKPGSEALISVWGKKSPRLKTKEKECFIPWTTRLDKPAKRYTYIYDKKELENKLKKIGFHIIHSWEERNINVIVKK